MTIAEVRTAAAQIAAACPHWRESTPAEFYGHTVGNDRGRDPTGAAVSPGDLPRIRVGAPMIDEISITPEAAERWRMLCREAVAAGAIPADGATEDARQTPTSAEVFIALKDGGELVMPLGWRERTWSN